MAPGCERSPGRKSERDLAAFPGGEFSADPAALLPGQGESVFFPAADFFLGERCNGFVDDQHGVIIVSIAVRTGSSAAPWEEPWPVRR